MIHWDKQYELGIPSIDDQHKRLVEIISSLSDVLSNAQEGDDIFDELVGIIESLTSYTVYHFKHEEQIFERLGYENTVAHQEEHKKLILQVESIDMGALDEAPVVEGKKILKMLIAWLFKHISGSDFKYRDLFLAHQIQ